MLSALLAIACLAASPLEFSADACRAPERRTVEIDRPHVLPTGEYDFSAVRLVVTKPFDEPALTFAREPLHPKRRNVDDLVRRDGSIHGLWLDCRWNSPGVAIHWDRCEVTGKPTVTRATGTAWRFDSCRESQFYGLAAFLAVGDAPVIDIQSEPETGDVANALDFYGLNVSACANDVYLRVKDHVVPRFPGRRTRLIGFHGVQLHAPWSRVARELRQTDELAQILDEAPPERIAGLFEPNPNRRLIVLDGCDTVTFHRLNARTDDIAGAAVLDLKNNPTNCRFRSAFSYSRKGQLLAEGSQGFGETGTRADWAVRGAIRFQPLEN